MSSKEQNKYIYFNTFIFAAILIIPLLCAWYFFNDLSFKHESYILLRAQGELASEMEKFSDSLIPTHYIDMAFEALSDKLGEDENKIRPLYPSKSKLTHYLKNDHTEFCVKFLEENFGIEPFLYGFYNVGRRPYLFSKYRIFPTRPSMAEFANVILCNAFLDGFNDKKTSVQADNLFQKYLSLTSRIPTMPGVSEPFYSGKFGNQLSYHIFNVYPKRAVKSTEISALDYFCINSIKIDNKILLKKSIEFQKIKGISRTFKKIENKSSLKFPVYKIDNQTYTYISDFPTEFYEYVSSLNLKSKEISEDMKSFVNNNCLSVSIPASKLISPYRKYNKFIKTAFYISSALILLFFIWAKHGKRLEFFKISGKLKLAVILVIVFPLIGFSIISAVFINNSKSSIYTECQQKLNTRISLLNKIFSEMNQHFIFASQLLRVKSCEFVFNSSDLTIPINYYGMEELDKSLMLKTFRFIRDDLSVFGFRGFRKEKTHPRNILPYYKIYDSLGLNNNKKALDEKLKLELLLNLTENYWKNFLTHTNLSAESTIQSLLQKLKFDRKSTFMLFAKPEEPFKALTLGVALGNSLMFINKKLKVLTLRNPELFTDYSEKYKIDYGVFARYDDKVIPNTLSNSSGYGKLAKLAKETLVNKQTAVKLYGNNMEGTYFSNSAPIIITAHAELNPELISKDNITIIVLILILYALFTVILLSQLLSDAFVSPIKVFTKFVDDIKNNNYNTSVKVNTEDELDMLANSFSDMAVELDRREKLRRFVSEGLYKSTLEAGENSVIETEATLLSSDIRSFTTISEANEPEEVVSLLNSYFTSMEQAINKYGGAIEKIVGDAILASFYPTEENDNTALRAVQAAIEMRKALTLFNQNRKSNNKFTIENGVGLSTGKVVFGFAGKTSRKREFLLVSDSISRAETLEAATKAFKTNKIAADEETEKRLKGKYIFNQFNEIHNSSDLKIFELIGDWNE